MTDDLHDLEGDVADVGADLLHEIAAQDAARSRAWSTARYDFDNAVLDFISEHGDVFLEATAAGCPHARAVLEALYVLRRVTAEVVQADPKAGS